MRAITEVLKKAIKCLRTSTCFLCWHTVYKGLHDFWPLYEHSLKHKSHFSVLTYLEIIKKYLPKYFPINIQYKFGENEHLRQKYFCDILTISKKCGRRRFSGKGPSTWVFRRKIKLIQEIPTTYSDYTSHLDAILRSLRFLDCEMSMLFCAICFDPRFKENVHCHPVFIIRDINSFRKGYLKDRLKSRESDHFNIQFVILSQTLRHVLRHS